MSYDLSFAHLTELSSGGGNRLDQTVSKASSLCPDVDARSDIGLMNLRCCRRGEVTIHHYTKSRKKLDFVQISIRNSLCHRDNSVFLHCYVSHVSTEYTWTYVNGDDAQTNEAPLSAISGAHMYASFKSNQPGNRRIICQCRGCARFRSRRAT